LGRFLLVVLALGLVTLESIGAQLHAERHVGGPLGLDGAPGQVGDEGGLARRRRDLAHADAAELDEILSLEVAGLADAHDDKTRQVERGRGDEGERRGVLPLDPTGRRRPPHQIAGRRQRAARGGPEFDPVLTEQDKNTLGGRPKGSKFKLQAAGHEAPPLDSLQSGSRFCGRNQACGDCANLFAIPRTKTRNGAFFAPLAPPIGVETGRWKAGARVVGAPSKALPLRPARRALAGACFARACGRCDTRSRLTFCCAYSKALPWPSHFVARSNKG